MRYLSGLIVLIICWVNCAQQSNEEWIIAKIGDYELTSTELADIYKQTPQYRSAGWVKPKLMKEFIMTEMVPNLLILEHAEKIGLQNDSEFKPIIGQLKRKILLDKESKLFREKITSQIQITEEQIKNVHSRLKNKYSLAQIFLNNKKIADSVYQLIESGESFEKICAEFSTDQKTADKGGVVGTYSWDHPALPEKFKSEVFSLKEKEISKPIEINGMYYVVKLISVIPNEKFKPFEQDSARIRLQLTQMAVNRRIGEYVIQLKKEANIIFNEEFIAAQNEKLQSGTAANELNLADTGSFTPEELEQNFVQYHDVSYSFGELIDFMRTHYPKMITTYSDYTELKQRVDANVLVQELMFQDALNLGYQNEEQFQAVFKRLLRKEILDYMKDEYIFGKHSVTEEDMKQFYEEHKLTLFHIDPHYSVRVIITNEEPKIQQAYQRLKNGEDFKKVAKELSDDKRTASRNGILGKIMKDDPKYQFMMTYLKELKMTGYSEPFEHEGKYYIVQKIAAVEDMAYPYELCKDRIKYRLNNFALDSLQKHYVDSLKQTFKVQFFDENLKKFIDSARDRIK